MARVLADGRLAVAARWLGQTEAALQAEQTGLRAEVERLSVALENSRKALESASLTLDRAAEALFLVRRGQMRAAVGRYLDEAAQYARLAVGQRVVEAASEVLTAGLREVRGRSQQVAKAQSRLRQARGVLTAREAELTRLAIGRSEINLATPDLVEALYSQHRGRPERAGAALRRSGGRPAGLG